MENDSVEYGLGFNLNLNQTFTTKLFAGCIYNSFQMNLYVQVYDNDGAFTIYYLPQNVVVLPDETDLELKLVETNIELNEGPYMESIKEIQCISSLLNIQSLSDQFGLILSGNQPMFPQMYGPLSNYSGVIPVNFSI